MYSRVSCYNDYYSGSYVRYVVFIKSSAAIHKLLQQVYSCSSPFSHFRAKINDKLYSVKNVDATIDTLKDSLLKVYKIEDVDVDNLNHILTRVNIIDTLEYKERMEICHIYTTFAATTTFDASPPS